MVLLVGLAHWLDWYITAGLLTLVGVEALTNGSPSMVEAILICAAWPVYWALVLGRLVYNILHWRPRR